MWVDKSAALAACGGGGRLQLSPLAPLHLSSTHEEVAMANDSTLHCSRARAARAEGRAAASPTTSSTIRLLLAAMADDRLSDWRVEAGWRSGEVGLAALWFCQVQQSAAGTRAMLAAAAAGVNAQTRL